MIRGVAYSPIGTSSVFQAIVSLVLIFTIMAKPTVDAIFHIAEIKTEEPGNFEKQNLEEKEIEADSEDEYQNLACCCELKAEDLSGNKASGFTNSIYIKFHYPDIALPPPEQG